MLETMKYALWGRRTGWGSLEEPVQRGLAHIQRNKEPLVFRNWEGLVLTENNDAAVALVNVIDATDHGCLSLAAVLQEIFARSVKMGAEIVYDDGRGIVFPEMRQNTLLPTEARILTLTPML